MVLLDCSVFLLQAVVSNRPLSASAPAKIILELVFVFMISSSLK
jgi:hypothetical protein